ncbi:MAG: TonB-dependent receptor plug domain-containing protein [Gemmatimonadota bacterium]
MRVFPYLVGAFALLVMPLDIRAQFPGEVRGVVVDVLSGRPVPSAEAALSGSSALAATDAAGSFRLRGIEPGRHTLRVRAPGYAPLTRDIAVENGKVTSVRVELVPEVVEVEGVLAQIEAGPTGARSLRGEELRGFPASTAGDLAASLPGVRIETRGRGGAQVPSIRASGGDAVLVLVDGVPINDPVTGEADLSTVRAGDVTAVHVLPGGQSARYGARAEGGVILLETTGSVNGDRSVGIAVGSLGEQSLDARFERELALGTFGVSAGVRRLDGQFGFEIPESAGGGRSTRENAHVRGEDASVRWSGQSDRVRFHLGASGERLERGLPGRAFAPSRTGDQALSRGRLFGSLEIADGSRRELATNGYFVFQTMEHRDSAPPFGDPFDDQTTLRGAGGEARGSMAIRPGTRLGAGLGVSHLRVRSTQLVPDLQDMTRTDAGLWLSGSQEGPLATMLSASARLDRSGLPGRWYVSHDVALAWSEGRFGARIGHRSSFSPPTLGDQFFREGVGVEPNPDLEAERVPSEWVVGVTYEGRVSGVLASVEAEAYHGDIQGMIVWLPDFRFVWSPRNRDVHRRGLDLSMRLGHAASGLDVRGHVAWNRATYARPGQEDVQVVYRPEHGGGVLVTWSSESWRASMGTDFVGARYPVPNRVNELPSFWTTDVSVARRVRTSIGTLEIAAEVERVFDHEDSLIFAFPDPGRTARVSVRLGR